MDNRYSRQINLENFGTKGQKYLSDARVLVLGAGGTGSLIIQYLIRMGIGFLRIVEPDFVILSNLHRQILYTEKDISKYKVDVLKERLPELNKKTKVEFAKTFFSKNNFEELLNDIDFIVDAVDSIKTKFLINKIAVKKSIPFVFSSVSDYVGQVFFVNKGGKPCLECLLGSIANRNDKLINGVFPPAIGMTSSLISSIVVRYFLKDGFRNNFFLIDSKKGEIKSKFISANKECFCNL